MRNRAGIDSPGVRLSARSRWASAANVPLVGLFFIAVMAVLYLTRSIVVPVVLALIIGTILSPLVSRAERHRVPRVVSTIFIVTVLLGALVFFAIATWMWGPIGAFLAVPIAMITVGVLQNHFPGPEHPSLP